MKTRLRLFLDWGITFGKPYEVKEQSARKVKYASRDELQRNIYAEQNVVELAEPHEDKPEKSEGTEEMDAPVMAEQLDAKIVRTE